VPLDSSDVLSDYNQSLLTSNVEVGDIAVAGARLRNSLTADIVVCATLSWFRRGIKSFPFRQSYPSVLYQFFFVVCAVFS